MSVRGDRVVYRTDREVEYDARSSAGSHLRPEPRDAPYTTRKVYRVPREEETEREERLTVIGGSDRRSDRERAYSENRVVIRRERTPEPEPVPERREIRVIEREREREPESREIRVIEREREREPEFRRYERPPEREYRYERDLDRRDDLERYTRTVDYYPRPEPPPPIVIRQEPQQIIFQEAPRAPLVIPAPQPKEEDFQLIQRSEIRQTEKSEVGSRHDEERSIARRPKPKEDEQEDYYYERRVREVSRDDRSRQEDDRYSRRERDREVSPGDSISQYGRDRDRHRGYESDDSYEYIRKETREDYSDGESPHHRRHIAEGAVAGLGAAELLRHHRKKTDGEEGSRRGRVGKDVGAAALGAIGAQAVSRARSHYREKSKSRRGSRDRDYSRSRSRSRSREGRRHKRRERSRSKSRPRSKSRVKQLAGLGLGAAAVAAAVGYANRQNKKNQVEDRRSRSRTRRHSTGPPPAEEAEDARNPAHRNKKIAQAGLAGAAVAGLVERARSKSRGGRGKSRSKSRIRTGIPIAAAGLGSAAIAGLYERNQAGKKDKEARKEERHARRERRSRSRSQSAPPYNEGARGDPGLIEYGENPVGYNNNSGVPDYYNRPASQQGYYNNQNAMVPAAAAAGAVYGEQQQRERQREASDSGSEGGRRRRRHRRHKSDSRSRSRSRGLAAAAAGAGVAGLAVSEHEKRKQRRKEEKRERRRREEAEQASYGQDPYAQQQQQPFSPNSPQPAGYVADGPQQPYFPPPPGAPFTPPGANYPPEYQNQQAIPPNAQVHPDYGYPPQGFQPSVPDAYSPPPGAAGYAPQQPREPRRADENVSADTPNVPNNDVPLYDSNGAPFYYEPNTSLGEGISTPRAQSPSRRPPLQRRATSQPPPTKSVKFNLSPSSSGPDSPTQIRNRRERGGSSKQSNHDGGYDSEDSPRHDRHRQRDGPDHDRPRKHRHRRASVDNPRDPSPTSSDSTVDLPPRFDKRGKPIPQTDEDQDPLTEKIQDLFSGKGSVGKFLQSLGGGSEDDGDRDGRRRRRRR